MKISAAAKNAKVGRYLAACRPLFAACLGLFLGVMLALVAGESPWHVLTVLARSAFGSHYDLGMTLFYATPLMFTGVSVSAAFRAGLFNIGAEGQLTMGALAAVAFGLEFPALAYPFSIIGALLAAFAAGAFWGAIPGWLKAYRGSHEVINTIMLNFVAAGLSSWITLGFLRGTATQNPETTALAPNYLLQQFAWFAGAPVGSSIIIAIAVVLLTEFLFKRTSCGYALRALGQNETAALTAGINVQRYKVFALTLAGGLAGLGGIADVLGSVGKFRIGFSADYGFTGIAVALLGRNRPLGMILASLLFASLHKGALDLDFETEHITRDFSMILQALIIFCVCADGLWDWLKVRRTPLKRPENAHA